ncbi:YitT family protein [Bariatricus sp. SGI.161]|uniref:YitT family protein n=1 Tax=Bariatricus sp. SGI.161 TaxID=3420550 RepID=UPI002A76D082|nr:YitT family protein [Lachnospiraceae bacterium]MCI6534820.1 YitT family protein [Lachnospiraceae bacterium]MDY2612519.1 YitT family protein [Lachnospiraceae bacterium]MDY4208042.1 YitT family protein [Lachnospiraceae bacterium]
MNQTKVKELAMDILVDVVAGMVIAIGVYNFALNANFPVAGFSGIAIILYHLFRIPVGIGTILLNIPVSIFCYKFLGRTFFLKSVKSMIISSILMDYVAPMFPVYNGSRLLAALCMGVLCGGGYAAIFMRGSSTGGQDFITMAIKKVKPHMTLGVITFGFDICTILLGTILVFKDVDGLIYGIIVTYLMAIVMDRIMYGIDEGKMTLIVTEHGDEVAEQIDEYSGRGSTILQGMGSYSKKKKDVVMCACNNKQMYTIKKMVRQIDPQAFTIIMESNEVVGEGFKEEISEI